MTSAPVFDPVLQGQGRDTPRRGWEMHADRREGQEDGLAPNSPNLESPTEAPPQVTTAGSGTALLPGRHKQHLQRLFVAP